MLMLLHTIPPISETPEQLLSDKMYEKALIAADFYHDKSNMKELASELNDSEKETHGSSKISFHRLLTSRDIFH